MADEKKSDLKVIQDGITALKAVGDPTVIDQAEKIDAAVKNIVAVNEPLVTTYAKELKAFDEGLVSKYGLQAARIVEFVMIVLIGLKLYYIG